MARAASSKPVQFKLYAPKAKKVCLAGSFNNWDTKQLTAKKDTKGSWSVKVSLPQGRHEYKFFVDGNWTSDPSCTTCVYNSYGSQNCIVDVK